MMTQTSHSKPDITDKLLYTASEACHIIFGNANKSTMNKMYRLLKSGAIESERVGGTWFIPRKVLVDLHGKDIV